MKVLFTTNIPSPYRIQFFNELSKHCDLTVVYERMTAKDRNKEWLNREEIKFKYKFLNGIKIGNEMAFCPGIINVVKKEEFDLIVVGGYSTPTSMLLIQYLKRKKMKFIINCDGGLIKQDKKIKYKIKKHFISSADAWLSTGSITTDYLKHYGANEKKIYIYPFTSVLEKEIIKDSISSEEKNKLKKELNIKEKQVIISIGQFIHRKGFDILLKSLENIDKEVGIYIIGGEPTQEYIDLKNHLSLDNVHFIGFKSKQELEKYYKCSDLFVLPTREDIWGLVINEAMAKGLPIITTDKCVAGIELIEEDKNGFIVPVNNIKEMTKKIKTILKSDKNKIECYRLNNISKAKEYTIENMAKKHIDIFKEIKKI